MTALTFQLLRTNVLEAFLTFSYSSTPHTLNQQSFFFFLASSLKYTQSPSLCSTFPVTTRSSHHFFLSEHCNSLLTGLVSTLTPLVYLSPSRRRYPCTPKSEHTRCKPSRSFLSHSELAMICVPNQISKLVSSILSLLYSAPCPL